MEVFVKGSIAVGLMLLATVSLFGQADANKGQITGTVLDPKGAVIPNAKIRIQNTNTNVVRELTSGAEGQFRAVLLDPGTYDVTINAAGFAPAAFKGVTLNVGSAVDLPASLQLGTTTQTIEVTANATSELPSPTMVIGATALEDLPINGRRFTDFAALTPTVQIDQIRGSISFAGQRGINGNVMVDGTDYNNPFFGGTRGGERSNYVPTIPQSAVEEFQAVTTGYAPEYGRSTGGILNVITKSGTNDLHGEGFYQIRHKETGLKTPFNTQSLETLQQYGGGAGGAIKKDKIFWFGAIERQVSTRPGYQVFFGNLVGVASTPQTAEALNYYHSLEGPFATTNDATALLGHGDYQLSNKNRLSTRFNFSDGSANNAITTGAPIPSLYNRALNGSGSEKDRTETGVANFTSIISASIANDLRFTGTHESRPRTSNSLIPNVSNNIGNFGARNFLPTVQDDTRYQFNDGLTVVKGTHAFKVGGDYNYLTTFQSFGFNQFGSFTFTTTDTATLLKIMSPSPGQNRFDSPFVQYRLELGNLLADYHMHQIAFYSQDSWKINPRLTLSYGVRWEGQVNPQAVASNTAVVQAIQGARFPDSTTFDPSKLRNNLNQWMPRVGVTFNPIKGSNKTVIRAHAGLFYAASPMLLFGGTSNNFRLPPGDVSVFFPGGSGPTVYQIFKAAGFDLNNYTLDKLPILTPTQAVNGLAAASGATPNPFLGASFTGTANDFSNPRSFQGGLGADQQITSHWMAGIQLNYINTIHLERNRDYNLPFPTLRAADGRFIFNRANRPLPQYGQITIRESSARSMYRGMSFNTRYTAGRVQVGAQYTVSQTYSNDDNERDATTFYYDNPFNLKAEYGYSNLDIRNQFAAYAVYTLPWWNIELSATARATSGQPIDPIAGADLNGDASSANDRAFKAPGVEFARNSFRNQAVKDVDFRFLKNIKIKERMKLQFSTEIFNLFNFKNVVIGPAAINNSNTIYGPGIDATGASVAPRVTFMRLKLANGNFDPNNSQIGSPFQAQFGLRLFF